MATLLLSVDGTEWPLSLDKIKLSEAEECEKRTGWTVSEWIDANQVRPVPGHDPQRRRRRGLGHVGHGPIGREMGRRRRRHRRHPVAARCARGAGPYWARGGHDAASGRPRLKSEIDGFGPVFRHLFGVTEDDVRTWPLSQYRLYQNYARQYMQRQQRPEGEAI